MHNLSAPELQVLLLNKPFQVMSQFSEHEGKETLARYVKQPSLYPAGRLDFDSEGLLLLTGNGQLQHLLTDPKHKLAKTYWVQVEGDISEDAIAQLRAGIQLKDGKTLPAQASRMDAPKLWERNPPIRFRANIPTAWLELTIIEGRNRQVRRMTAATGFPTLRLIRVAIGPWTLQNLAPGESRWANVPDPISQRLKTSARKVGKAHFQRSKAR